MLKNRYLLLVFPFWEPPGSPSLEFQAPALGASPHLLKVYLKLTMAQTAFPQSCSSPNILNSGQGTLATQGFKSELEACAVPPAPAPSSVDPGTAHHGRFWTHSLHCHPPPPVPYHLSPGLWRWLPTQAPCLTAICCLPCSPSPERSRNDIYQIVWLQHGLGDPRMTWSAPPRGFCPQVTAPAAVRSVPLPSLPTSCSPHVPSLSAHLLAIGVTISLPEWPSLATTAF